MTLPKRSFDPAAACPLDGIRVIDLSSARGRHTPSRRSSPISAPKC